MENEYIIKITVAGTILFVVFVFFLVAYLIVHKRKQNAFKLEKHKMIYDHENKMLRARMEEYERALTQVSKEIHDNIGQEVNFARMHMRMIAKLSVREEQSTLIHKADELLHKIDKDVRSLSHTLNSDYIKVRGLHDILLKDAEHITASKDVECILKIEGKIRNMDTEKELLIYRIAQEVINNAVRHAEALRIDILLAYKKDSFIMNITDNGIGFDPKMVSTMDGIGLLNMYQRAKALGGKIEVRSAIGKGTTVTLTIKNAVYVP